MNNRVGRLIGVVGAVLAAMLSPVAVRAEVEQSPEVTVKAFYRWYLHALGEEREPFLKDRSDLKKFVTTALLSDIERRRKSPDGLSMDYFIQAQDYLEDWEASIATMKTVVKNTTATTIVILGDKDESRHKLLVGLRQESGAWKIASVRSLK